MKFKDALKKPRRIGVTMGGADVLLRLSINRGM
jgi:hypothetical protein